jgi:biopolymer transport protein ExbD
MNAGGRKKGIKKMAIVGPNMTPMVDVVMCILIFFMLGSSFIMPELFLKSSMPAVDTKGLGDQKTDQKMPAVRLFIKMSRQGDNTFVSAFDSALLQMNKVDDIDQKQNDEIKGFFKSKNQTLSPDVQIIIQPKADVPYQDVITIYDYCVRAQFKQVAFAPAG